MTHRIAAEAGIAEAGAKPGRLRETLNTVLFGQEKLIEHVLTGLLARGHLLLEGLPGLGKTELVKGLAQALRLEAKRIQFTPDLLPGDITGNPILNEVDGRRQFVFQPGTALWQSGPGGRNQPRLTQDAIGAARRRCRSGASR